MRIRLADLRSDAEAVTAIYLPIVEETHISFEETAPGPTRWRVGCGERWNRTPGWRPRPTATWPATPTPPRTGTARLPLVGGHLRPPRPPTPGRGIGRLLYDELLGILSRRGYFNVHAGVAFPNPASEALHRSIGMSRIGVYEGVGHAGPVVGRGRVRDAPE